MSNLKTNTVQYAQTSAALSQTATSNTLQGAISQLPPANKVIEKDTQNNGSITTTVTLDVPNFGVFQSKKHPKTKTTTIQGRILNGFGESSYGIHTQLNRTGMSLIGASRNGLKQAGKLITKAPQKAVDIYTGKIKLFDATKKALLNGKNGEQGGISKAILAPSQLATGFVNGLFSTFDTAYKKHGLGVAIAESGTQAILQGTVLLETGKVAGVKGAASLIVNKSDVLKWINWRQLSPELADITSKLTLSQFKAIKDAYSKNQYVRIYASNKFITQHIKSEIIELCSHGISPQNALKMIQEGDRAYQAKLINLNPQRTEMLHELGFTSIKVSARLGRNLRSLENIYKNNGYDALKKMYDQARGHKVVDRIVKDELDRLGLD